MSTSLQTAERSIITITRMMQAQEANGTAATGTGFMIHTTVGAIDDPNTTQVSSISGSSEEPDNDEVERGYLTSLYLNQDIGKAKPEKNSLTQLRDCVKYQIFSSMKFLPYEGKTLEKQERMRQKFPSFDLPDLRLRSGCHYKILKEMGCYKKGKTVEDRVGYWKTHRKAVKSMILAERSSRTQAMKECVVEGKCRVVCTFLIMNHCLFHCSLTCCVFSSL
jgi:acyl-CoA-binding protein